MEKWKQSEEFPNYEISYSASVRSIKTGRVLKTSTDRKGYETISLRKNGQQFTRKVHRLVAETFLRDKYRPGLEVTHKNGDRSKNEADNLEWKRRSDIIRKTYENGRRQTHRMKRVRVVETGEIYDSIVDCSKATGVSKSTISRLLTRRALVNRCGLTFEYVD